MLLDELRKYTPESHVDYDTIRQALELIRDTADTVNNVAKLAEQQRKVRKSLDSRLLIGPQGKVGRPDIVFLGLKVCHQISLLRTEKFDIGCS